MEESSGFFERGRTATFIGASHLGNFKTVLVSSPPSAVGADSSQ